MKANRLTIDNLQLTTDMFRVPFGQMSPIRQAQGDPEYIEGSNVKCQPSTSLRVTLSTSKGQILRRRGQSLIEVVIAMAVIVGLAVALVTTTLVVQRASRTAKNTSQATKLVQQNIEQVRILRDRQGFASLANNDCWVLTNTADINPNNWKLANNSSDPSVDCPESVLLNQVVFDRSLKIEIGANSDQKKVTVTVSWTDSGGTQSVINQTILSSND